MKRGRRVRVAAALCAGWSLACGAADHMQRTARRDATLGLAPPGFDPASACGGWREALEHRDPAALWHDAHPELSPAACFIRVVHGDGPARADPIPRGCGYPEPGTDPRPRLLAEASRLEATPPPSPRAPPGECSTAPDTWGHAAARNARVLRTLAAHLGGRRYPYAAIATFGYGHPSMDNSLLVGRSPEATCAPLPPAQAALLNVMRTRAGRAAAAYHGGVAPAVIVSGGAVHSRLVEAFALDYLLRCWFSVPADRVLLEPCADHTHTNIRNTGAWLVALGARTAYLVTDDGIQGQYLADPGPFAWLGASVDQRALSEWGSSLGSYHPASVGIRAGFWYTPYRFWAEARDGAGGLTCVR